MTVADHLPQAWFDVDERRRQPALPLARVLPMIDLRAPFLDEGIDRFQAIRRLERTAQDPVHAESMREGLLSSRTLLELSMELFEGRPGFVVLRALVRPDHRPRPGVGIGCAFVAGRDRERPGEGPRVVQSRRSAA